MRFCRLKGGDKILLYLFLNGRFVALEDIYAKPNIKSPGSIEEVIGNKELLDQLEQFTLPLDRAKNSGIMLRSDQSYAVPFSNPGKIWSIGLNYGDHAKDLNVKQPEKPASFMKPKSSMITQGGDIILPKGFGRITAEAELGIIIGKRGKYIEESDAMDYIFGIAPIIDMTAIDILLQNPRFLTMSKSFDTFFSIGPMIATKDEFEDLQSLKISTIKNGVVEHSNYVRNMLFSPEKLISFHSQIFTFEPGDIISTGTPGAVEIQRGDMVKCLIEGEDSISLENKVL